MRLAGKVAIILGAASQRVAVDVIDGQKGPEVASLRLI